MMNHWETGTANSKYISRFAALLRFNLGAGIRLVQRIFLPLFVLFFFFYFLLGTDFFINLSAAVVGGGYFSASLPGFLFILIITVIAGNRVTTGLTGWMQHLPAANRNYKTTAMFSILISITPLLLIPAFLSVAAGEKHDISVFGFLAGLPLAGLAAALMTLPTRNRYFLRVILILAGLLNLSGNWYCVLAGLIILILAARYSGPLVLLRKKIGFSSRKFINFILLWRALGWRLLWPYLIASGAYFFLYLFMVNNTYGYRQSNMILRMAVGLNLIIFCGVFCQIMAARRPVWPWQRSLPLSAGGRIFNDSAIIAVHLLPLMFFAAVLKWQMLMYLFCALPGLVLISARGMRRGADSRFGVIGQILGPTVLPVLLFVLLPWMSLISIVFIPWLIKYTVASDKSLAVSQWQETAHLAESDSQSWSGQ